MNKLCCIFCKCGFETVQPIKTLLLLAWLGIWLNLILMFCEALHVYKGPCSHYSKDESSNIYSASLAVWRLSGNHRRMKGLATESDWLLTG